MNLPISYYETRIGELEWALRQLQEQNANLALACERLLEYGHGCPMCDSGILRNPAKSHWDSCGYEMARQALAQLEPTA